MTNGVEGAIYIMITAVIISVFIMMQFAVPVGNFVNKHPSIQILGLAFLILIGMMLLKLVQAIVLLLERVTIVIIYLALEMYKHRNLMLK
jgi:predicted tellurium resistance membrane protein TerC